MSRAYRSFDPLHIFTAREEIENHLQSKIHGNTQGLIGTELELFVLENNKPASFAVIETLLTRMAGGFDDAVFIRENGHTVGLHLAGVGDVCLEPGGQVELSTKACKDLSELEEAHDKLMNAFRTGVSAMGLSFEGRGHLPAFLQAPDMPRSRFEAYYRYCRDRHGAPAEDLIATMKSACGLQVNVDPMGEAFHEIYRALMFVDLAVSFAQKSERQKRLHDTYAGLFPEQVTPLFNAAAARSNNDLIGLITDRLLTLKVPFIPADTAEGFKSTLDVFGYPPTVGELLRQGLLTREILDNALSLQMTMPNLRRHGVLETRAPDSVCTTGEVMQTAALYRRYAYDAEARRDLLASLAEITPASLQGAYEALFSGGEVHPVAKRIKSAVFDVFKPQNRPVSSPKI